MRRTTTGAFAASFVMAAVFLFPQEALAWGAGAHMAIAERTADALRLEGPYGFAAAVSRHPAAFLAGNLLPDIFAIRNWFLKPKPFVHSWPLARKLLESAENGGEIAFSIGYITHLSADVICHNFFIPQYIFFHDHRLKLAHLAAESQADGCIGRPEILHDACNALEPNPGISRFFLRNSGLTEREFSVNLGVFRKAISLKRSTGVDHAALSLASGPESGFVSRVEAYMDHSVGLSARALQDPPFTLPLDYCPEGERRIRLSGIRRRLSIRNWSAERFRQSVIEGRLEYVHRIPQSLAGAFGR